MPVAGAGADVTGVVGEVGVDELLPHVESLVADLGSDRLAGGSVTASGRWAPDRWNVVADLRQVRPSALDARAPETSLDGKALARFEEERTRIDALLKSTSKPAEVASR